MPAAASAAPLAANQVIMAATSQAYRLSNPLTETKPLMPQLFRRFCNSKSYIYEVTLSRLFLQKPPKCSVSAPLFLKVRRVCYASPACRYGNLAGWKNVTDLVGAANKPKQMGQEWSTPNHDPILHFTVLGGRQNVSVSVKAGPFTSNNGIKPHHRCIVLDIEGTTTPISFVADVLFPFARDNVRRHLYATYDTTETKDDVKLLRSQVEDDLKQGIDGAVPIPSDDAGKEEVIAALVANVEAMIKADRKITALKQLQGHIWRTGFQNNEIEAVVFNDVPEALEKWHSLGIKAYIYSSGSRLAQRLIFGNTNYGDLRKYLCGFFDTTVGGKKETRSYIEISEFVGVDEPSEILFVTDVYQEAIAAKAAGLEVVISVRPGNGALPEDHGFKTISSFSEI